MNASDGKSRPPLLGNQPVLPSDDDSRDVPISRRELPRGRVGLALSGGGARGLAHIGVLRVLERERIPIHCLSGASMGGIIAAATSAGFSAAELEKIALEMSSLRRLVQLVDWAPPTRGIIAGHKLRTFLSKFFPPDLTFHDLRVPLALEAVDLDTGEEVALTEGSVLDAVMATAAVPGVLPPVEWQGRRLVDGGVLDNLPVDLVRSLGAEIVIAVNVGLMPDQIDENRPSGTVAHWPTFIQTAVAAVTILTRGHTLTKLQMEPPDLLIHPHLPPNLGAFSSFTRAKEIIETGERAAVDAFSAPASQTLLGPSSSFAESATKASA